MPAFARVARASGLDAPHRQTASRGLRISATTRSGTAASDRWAFTPSTLQCAGLTGKRIPPKGLQIRLLITARPTLPGVFVAPNTATVAGITKTLRKPVSSRRAAGERVGRG